MSTPNILTGDKLHPRAQREALGRFVYRHTGDHPSRASVEPTFASDAEWLKGTEFYVNKDGSLSNRHRHCRSLVPRGFTSLPLEQRTAANYASIFKMRSLLTAA